jgi:hypothetical protein
MTHKILSFVQAEREKDWMSHYIKRRNDGFLTTSDLLDFATQIANGMNFLHGKGVSKGCKVEGFTINC